MTSEIPNIIATYLQIASAADAADARHHRRRLRSSCP